MDLIKQNCLLKTFLRTNLKRHNISVTSKIFRKIITNLDSSKPSGPYSILVLALKNCESEGSCILAELFNMCLKGCVHYIFTSLFCMPKREDLWIKGKCFLFHFESSFHSWDNQILTFQIFKCHDVIKCPSMKHETHFTE